VLVTRLAALVERREVWPIGATQARPLNLRIILARQTEAGAAETRDPVWHRLGAVQIAFPPLAERREDVPELFRLFVVARAREYGLPAPAIGAAEWHHVQTHDWPGNLHELGGYARAFVLGLTATASGTAAAPALGHGARPLHQIVAEFERTVLEDALRQCRGDVTAVQQMLETPRKTLYDKLAKHALKPARYR
jgi:two-component system C4-dicarboxylate transport response regulator DctD